MAPLNSTQSQCSTNLDLIGFTAAAQTTLFPHRNPIFSHLSIMVWRHFCHHDTTKNWQNCYIPTRGTLAIVEYQQFTTRVYYICLEQHSEFSACLFLSVTLLDLCNPHNLLRIYEVRNQWNKLNDPAFFPSSSPAHFHICCGFMKRSMTCYHRVRISFAKHVRVSPDLFQKYYFGNFQKRISDSVV